MSILSAALTLFLVMDPIGNVPTFAALLKDVDARRWSGIILRESVIALVTLLFFLLAGPTLMGWLHIEAPALNIAGGIVLLIIALQMIFPRGRSPLAGPGVEAEPFIVPLAIPLIAGPSAMAIVMLMSTQLAGRRLECVAALTAAWAAATVLLVAGSRVQKLLGPRGLRAAERLMGMILIVVAVNMTLSGVAEFMRMNPL
jgi:multiple antibiotic resistance protein